MLLKFKHQKHQITCKHWKKIKKEINGENVPHLEINEVVLIHCNIVANDYQHDSRVWYAFVPHKPFGSLLENSPTNHIFLKEKYQNIEVLFADHNNKPLN